MREKTVAIIGQGYVGLPLAMAAVDAGWSVIGIEKSVSRLINLIRDRAQLKIFQI